MGFSVYNNALVTVRHAQNHHSLGRILILDWGVHHGNGTQNPCWRHKSVLCVLLHQDNLFPIVWGVVDAVGEGAGEGYPVNIPLPGGTGNAGYAAVFERVVTPIVRVFDPNLIVVLAGPDASDLDLLARMAVTVERYRAMTGVMVALAEGCCEGRLMVSEEGGHAAPYAPYCSAAVAEVLVSDASNQLKSVGDPYRARAENLPSSRFVGLDCQQALDDAIAVQRGYWPL